MRYFGRPWGAPVNETVEHDETPVGRVCQYCNRGIESQHRGFIIPDLTAPDSEHAVHLYCMLLNAVGPGLVETVRVPDWGKPDATS